MSTGQSLRVDARNSYAVVHVLQAKSIICFFLRFVVLNTVLSNLAPNNWLPFNQDRFSSRFVKGSSIENSGLEEGLLMQLCINRGGDGLRV